MKRHMAAIGIGLLVTSIYLAALGVVDSTSNSYTSSDEALGYGIAVFCAATAGGWLLLASRERRDGPL
ncbi:MAG TPA: hypothetical protein VFY93_12810 [Planctomycetota bacterium]|nr:hypothetical protein [Planctomycetota bacterium]